MSFYVTDCKSIAGETVCVVGGDQRPSVSETVSFLLQPGCLQGCFGRRQALADFLLLSPAGAAGVGLQWERSNVEPRMTLSSPAAQGSELSRGRALELWGNVVCTWSELGLTIILS